ncbi:prolyl-tRNA synthetase [Aeropyrum pernix K1]|uniref:Proline--tRNA ligase n=1 Tax=Aeropyrum pernix (strain ATCC 700893 / DSM 11879 / JCM 9820 / NBRC 100138 / K1) TaxID=272557 RepID=SYP_AERPE|nr:proline--tRNA ligase [Aeropyrum pernix]Q9Y9G0.1 RecName: Full=Proline--tRNA ligase; AltName: Full=Prolyl-tRNA synthetase; Short=ProRS [Aeropyrum pernix K1]BAA81340.1 prolyl-tRNA synthetase [Aeropyrum pernix K1]
MLGPPSREKWSSDFPRWFDWVIETAEVYDYGRYPVKGMGVWMPYGFQIRRRVLEVVRGLLDSTGHEEVLFPLLIPEHLLRRESEHIRGFEGEVYWVTHGGREELDVKLALRPTSETSITYMETFWIKSYRQLPKKYYQVVSIFRYETKATRPMIRLREVTTFKEAHTVHESFEDAERQVLEAIEVYKAIFDRLLIPYVISKRPEWDKFAGALYTIAFDTIMPDGRALQIGTVHHLGQSFTRAFDFRIQMRDERLDHPWQTSYGVSDRVVASLIAVHGDDRGLVIPPSVAPIQVVVIPITPGDEEKRGKVLTYTAKAAEALEKAGLRVHVDDREWERPGAKFYYWEAKGVPIRVEIGLREAEQDTLTIARRDTLEKTEVPLGEAGNRIRELMAQIESSMRERAKSFFGERLLRTESLEEARDWVEGRRGIAEIPWCGRESCGLEMEERVNGKVLGTPWPEEPVEEGKRCPLCGRPAVAWIRLAKTY